MSMTLGTCYSVWMTLWHAVLKHVETDKYTKNKHTKDELCIKLNLFTRLYRDAPSTKHNT
jgi:hypothetical protein